MTRGLTVIVGLALGVMAFGQSHTEDHAIEQPFSEGGLVTMHLSSGDYAVRAGAADRIRVHWRADEAKHEPDMTKIVVRTNVSQGLATIHTKGPTTRARFTIDIPARSDMHLRVRAGDVRIHGIEGNKDVRMTAGDLDIDVTPGSLSHVHASVALGDLKAHPLGIMKDGIRNRLDWFGEGRYSLDARVFAGDVTIR